MSGGWDYCNAHRSAHGTMNCTVCNKEVTEGDYRYRQKSSKGDWKYQSQHRACSTDDPVWARMDQARIDAIAHEAKLTAACIAFHAEWGVTDLWPYLPEFNQ